MRQTIDYLADLSKYFSANDIHFTLLPWRYAYRLIDDYDLPPDLNFDLSI